MVPGMDLAPKDCIGDSGVVADTFDAIAVDLNVGRHRRASVQVTGAATSFGINSGGSAHGRKAISALF